MGESGTTDEIKGRAKEAAGAAMDDEELKKEGRLDQAAAGIKQKAAELVDTVREKLGGHESKEDR